MSDIGVWSIDGEGSPARIRRSRPDLERRLEEWIEEDPSLLEGGLVIIGRQIRTDGGPLDLLALDLQGQLVVIEIKRDRLRRDVVAQAVDYAAWVRQVPSEVLQDVVAAYLDQNGTGATLAGLLQERAGTGELDGPGREVRIYLVGTRVDPGLSRIVDYLASVPIQVVSFDFFELPSGQRLLVRELTEADPEQPKRDAGGGAVRGDDLMARADQLGTGPLVRKIFDAAIGLGLHPRYFKKSIMFAPPAHKARCLFTVWISPNQEGQVRVWVQADAIAQFYDLAEEDVEAALGDQGYHHVDAAEVDEFVTELGAVFAEPEA